MVGLWAILGFALLIAILHDAFETIVLPRRVTRRFRITSIFYRYTWRPFSYLALRIKSSKRREAFVGFYGPISLLFLLTIWAFGLVLAYALLHWSTGANLEAPEKQVAFRTVLYYSGSTFFTLGLGEIRPLGALERVLSVVEAANGFGFLALVIGYLPIIYQAFSARESTIVLLDARAGSPPSAYELLRREGSHPHFIDLLKQWEDWTARLLESHLSYPVLVFFRSQHDNQSWLSALTTILDASAFSIAALRGETAHAAELTFAIARHAVVDLSNVLKRPPRVPGRDRLSSPDFQHMCQMLARANVPVDVSSEAEDRLHKLRVLYEPYVNALAQFLLVALPDWVPERARSDNWLTSAWGRAQKPFAVSGPFDMPD